MALPPRSSALGLLVQGPRAPLAAFAGLTPLHPQAPLTAATSNRQEISEGQRLPSAIAETALRAFLARS